MIVRRVRPLSVAKVSGVLYAVLGLIGGAMFALIAQSDTSRQSGGVFVDAIFGAGALVLMPIGYGLIGFLFTLIMAGLYNVVARVVGGIEIETDLDR